MSKVAKTTGKNAFTRFLKVDVKSTHYPILIRLYFDQNNLMGNSFRYGNWSGLAKLPRVWLWWTAIVNAIAAGIFVSLFVAVGTPILAAGYTWWLLALALFTVATMSLNTIKLTIYLIEGQRHA